MLPVGSPVPTADAGAAPSAGVVAVPTRAGSTAGAVVVVVVVAVAAVVVAAEEALPDTLEAPVPVPAPTSWANDH